MNQSGLNRLAIAFSLGYWFALLTAGVSQPPAPPGAVRIKDIASVQGMRGNQLIGYGLVIGLEGTGDSKGALFTAQSIANMLERFGITVPAKELKVKNVAAVIATAELPPYAKPGTRLDVTVSSLGDARSLQGGTLLQTPLMGADGKVYAVAQGALSIGGFNFSAGGSSAQKNHSTVGRIPGGALVEREVAASFRQPNDTILIQLHQPDFTTATRVAAAIRQRFPQLSIRTPDPATISLQMPAEEQEDPVLLVALLENLRIEPDMPAKVVINERTGTIVIGGEVRIAPAAIAHGGLSVRIQSQPQVSQPPPLSGGKTTVTKQTEVQVEEKPAKMTYLSEGVSVESLVKALNALGVTPRDLIAILQALRSAGALHAEIEVQ